jgi:hypothetical protein
MSAAFMISDRTSLRVANSILSSVVNIISKVQRLNGQGKYLILEVADEVTWYHEGWDRHFQMPHSIVRWAVK